MPERLSGVGRPYQTIAEARSLQQRLEGAGFVLMGVPPVASPSKPQQNEFLSPALPDVATPIFAEISP
ncbi:hypothetical protein [Haladaptatus caseinilyticus]|uniref:hypothetical protein n=1 Tax=Haladaptatus caseinilyticus TaxID=2993314 RepID=UPI00224B2590|nr:hypothetical protein [Haladaptatus caseinilyticus]